MKVGFIGTGNMGGALARAAAKSLGLREVFLCDKDTEKAQKLADTLEGCAVVNDVRAVVLECDYVFLGVKPQVLQAAIEEIRECLKDREKSPVFVSMAAGVTLERLDELFQSELPIIRIMPNLAASVGEGMIMYVCNRDVSAADEKHFLKFMEKAGIFKKIDEKLIDAGSAISGCGPAFVALFTEALADGGVQCGLTRSDALLLAEQTIYGTVKLLMDTEKHPGVLKDEVCSPGGTTIEGVKVLEENAFRGTLMKCVRAAYEKNFKLS